MHYLVTNLDHPSKEALRLETRDEHLAYLRSQTTVRLVLAGPLMSDDGTTMTGSHLVVEAESRAAVEAFCAADPYAKAGLFQESQIHPWKWIIGNPDAKAT
ncbi:MAG: YciI family protein [Myxococcota bacterium]